MCTPAPREKNGEHFFVRHKTLFRKASVLLFALEDTRLVQNGPCSMELHRRGTMEKLHSFVANGNAESLAKLIQILQLLVELVP